MRRAGNKTIIKIKSMREVGVIVDVRSFPMPDGDIPIREPRGQGQASE